MTTDLGTLNYRERLLPGPSLFIALLLVIPAVALVLTPISAENAVPVAVTVYVLLALVSLLLSPSIRVQDGFLVAGRAQIPVSQLGIIEPLGAEALRAAIGPGLDARSFLLVRGWIHRGVRIENIDASDPAPQWILTSRHPEKLANAIQTAQRS